MHYKAVFSILFSLFWGTANANWKKISDIDYTWGPFSIYHITLFTETGEYTEGVRPLMLTLQYKKPWEGRDFAVSLARTWKNLDIKLPEKEVDTIITNLRKTFPNIKPEDTLHYIALEDRGYFILNNRVVSDTFNKEFTDAIVAIWLDPKMDISRQLLASSDKQKSGEKSVEPKVSQKLQSDFDTKESVNTTESNTPEVVPVEQKVETTVVQTEAGSKTVKTTETSEVTNQEGKFEDKVKSKEEPKNPKIENPETFISPIYDDFLMLLKNYI